MRRLYVGLSVVATGMFILWLLRDRFPGSWVADWTPNIATDAITILITVAVVDRILDQRERARLKPRVDRAMGEVGGEFRMMVRVIAVDYALTHMANYQPVPETSLGVLDHWVEHVADEDSRRPALADNDPPAVLSALHTAESLKRIRAEDRDVLEPDVVAEIDAFEEGARMGFALWSGLPGTGPDERAREAIGEVVAATRSLGEVLIRHDQRWLEEGDTFGYEAGTWGTDAVRGVVTDKRDSPPLPELEAGS